MASATNQSGGAYGYDGSCSILPTHAACSYAEGFSVYDARNLLCAAKLAADGTTTSPESVCTSSCTVSGVISKLVFKAARVLRACGSGRPGKRKHQTTAWLRDRLAISAIHLISAPRQKKCLNYPHPADPLGEGGGGGSTESITHVWY